MFISATILFYNGLTLLGLILFLSNAMRRVFPASPIPQWLQWLMAFGFSGPLLSAIGFTGFFRLPGVPIAIGLILACYAVAHYNQFRLISRTVWREEPQAYFFVAIMLLLLMAGKWCYLQGGINNNDEYRSVLLTSGFAANYLKPAFPTNLSLPVSYGYYLFEISAFLYATVNGYSWPELPIVSVNLACIAFFYCAFVCSVRVAFPGHTSMTKWIALSIITFYGISTSVAALFNIHYRTHSQLWHNYQFTTMIYNFHWTYHYLLGLGFVLAALISLAHYCKDQHRHWLFTATAAIGFTLTFSAITGIWLLGLLMFCAIVAAAYSYGYIPAFLRHMPICLIIMSIILLPQVFTFMGHEHFVSWDYPRAWFTREVLFDASESSISNISILFHELGPMLFIGMLGIPFYGIIAFRDRNWFLAAIAGMGIIAILGATFTNSSHPDWYWRGSNNFLILSAAFGAIWLYDRGRYLISSWWLHIVVLIGILPCVIQFGNKVLEHTNRCYPADEISKKINTAIDLHTVLQNQQPDLQLKAILAGRIYYDNALFKLPSFITLYHNEVPFLIQYLGYDSHASICQGTVYGMALPQGLIACTTSTGNFKTYTCMDTVAECIFSNDPK